MCNVIFKDRKPSSELRERLGHNSIGNCIRLRWFGHVKRCNDNNVVKKCKEIVVEGRGNKERDLERLGTKSWIVI